ncbi:unnamed protein product [Bursaphelenchus okinawaensis]|uniref:FGF n=1 Tax=Bursaphelenchus okinawaensis TaxID=465554 RepID=A0A811KMQ1_9BILA|nr:unnamed protein product [Bursaphelenchus okinawaensis]CAG9106803.1 unnamed protein product [Bursaphelenchus okinawaensis]
MDLMPTPSTSTLFYEPIVPSIISPPGLRRFDDQDLLAVTSCARAARNKVNMARERLDTRDADEILLSRLPLYQNRIEHPYKQGAIYCRSGGWIEILDERADLKSRPGSSGSQHDWIRGTKRETSRFAILEFISIAFGLISIRGLESQNFLCMDWKGALYATSASEYSSECVFTEEMLENYYNLYSSCAYGTPRHPWYLSIRKSGKSRRGNHARKRQRSSHFIVVHFDETGILDPVPGHLNRAVYNIQNNWYTNYGTKRSSKQHVYAPAALLNSERRTLSELLSNSLRSNSLRLQKNNRLHKDKNRLQKARNSTMLKENIQKKVSKNQETMSEAEKRVFRQERKRRRRLHREERLRQLRRQKLQKMRNEAAELQRQNNV